MSASTEKKIREIVTSIVHCDEKALEEGKSWKELKADSLDLVQILVALEEQFGLEISDEDAEKLKSFKDLVNYIDGALEAKGKTA
jgi:acyl carrier protein